jgi:hypothetical protein
MSLATDSSSNVPSPDGTAATSYDSNCQQLREYIQRLRSHPLNAHNIDAAAYKDYSKIKEIAKNITPHQIDAVYKEYNKIKDAAKTTCESLLGPQSQLRARSSSLSGTLASLTLSETASLTLSETRTSVSSRGSIAGPRSPYIYEQHVDLIRAWIECLGNILQLLKTSLLDTYLDWEPQASPGMVNQLFKDKKFRKNGIARMRNASIAKTVSANLDFFPKYEMRFRDYDKLRINVNELQSLLQNGETGITPDRSVEEITISDRGDAVLQFGNKSAENFPVIRFRVSSHMLAETSPIFSRMFNGDPALLGALDEEASRSLPPPPSPFICKDGTEVKLFRMPQLELNVRNSLGILLHAAHMHNDLIPREIEFETFVAIAEVCMQYQCTSPLELSVEYRWLPQWMHKATEEMPDGLLLISYAFGLRRLFTRTSKTVILNIADENELETKAWPQGIKDKVKAVRTAKVNQVYACCSSLMAEYLRCPPYTPPAVGNDAQSTGIIPTNKPRCVKSSHACDAASLGWLMLLFNELHVLPQLAYSTALPRRLSPPKRSLNQLVDSLRFMASPPHIHDGLCDFVPTFRSAINDIYNSVSGLTLFEVSGKHGWALSKNKTLLPQPVLKLGPLLVDPDVARRATQDVALQIMKQLDDLEDVYSAALINKAFFEAFKKNELLLLRVLLGKTKNPERWTINGASNKKEARDEMKTLRDTKLELQKTQAMVALDGIEDHASEHSCEQSDMVSTVEMDMAGLSLNGESLPDEKMTREEAEKIMWAATQHSTAPTTPIEPQGNPPGPAGPMNMGAARNTAHEAAQKFRAGDPMLAELEGKRLVVNENKNLSDEHYQRIGLVRPPETLEGDIGSVSDWI